jgi:hypothetical protein
MVPALTWCCIVIAFFRTPAFRRATLSAAELVPTIGTTTVIVFAITSVKRFADGRSIVWPAFSGCRTAHVKSYASYCPRAHIPSAIRC